MKIAQNHRKVEKLLNHVIFWDSNLTGYYTNDNNNKVYIHLKYNDDNSKIRVGIQNFDVSNQYTYFYLDI